MSSDPSRFETFDCLGTKRYPVVRLVCRFYTGHWSLGYSSIDDLSLGFREYRKRWNARRPRCGHRDRARLDSRGAEWSYFMSAAASTSSMRAMICRECSIVLRCQEAEEALGRTRAGEAMV